MRCLRWSPVSHWPLAAVAAGRAPPAAVSPSARRRCSRTWAGRCRGCAWRFRASAMWAVRRRWRFSRRGAAVVAMSDSTGGVYGEDGLDVAEILDYAAGGRHKLRDYRGEGVEPATNGEVLTCACDVVIPSGLSASDHAGYRPAHAGQDRGGKPPMRPPCPRPTASWKKNGVVLVPGHSGQRRRRGSILFLSGHRTPSRLPGMRQRSNQKLKQILHEAVYGRGG